MKTQHFDVLIVGAGLSGIGAACFLQKLCPDKTYAIVEMRETSGGTWDLFRYPGIRSDSDMYTLGYSFRPWKEEKAIAEGGSILNYIRETAKDHSVEQHIRYSQRVVSASWSSAEALWTVEIQTGGGERGQYTCRFLHMCSGYYDYAQGYSPEFPGAQTFKGRIVHPQKWTPDIDYRGKRVVVIGSGATAVTLVPEMAKQAEHVTMLQRSPSYILSLPSQDRLAHKLRRWLPAQTAYAATRWKNVMLSMLMYQIARRRPQAIKNLVRKGITRRLGADCDMSHFTPTYNPWDQRLCLVPDANLFKTIRSGRASVVTDHIERFTETGIRLKSGQELQADIVVSATGLNMLMMGGAQLIVDDKPVSLPEHTVYKGMMLDEVPNFAFAVGYTNASWTLKCDLVSQYVCRLLKHMDRRGVRQCTPHLSTAAEPEPLIDFDSGYVTRAAEKLPKQGSRAPWKLRQNYALDILTLRFGSVTEEMQFSNPATEPVATAA